MIYIITYYTLSDGKAKAEIEADTLDDAIQYMIDNDQQYCFAQLIDYDIKEI